MTAPAKTRPAKAQPARAPGKAQQRSATAAAGGVPRPGNAPPAPTPPRAILWLVGPNPRHAPRAPFVLLIIGLLGCGLIGLLLLNTATASASFREQSLQDRNSALTLQQQDLQREVSALDAPQALARAAAKLGMVPGPDPAFLELFKNGTSKIIGDPNPVSAPVPPPPPPSSPAPPNKPTPKKTTQKKVSPKPTPTGHPTSGHPTDQHTTDQHSPVPQHRQTHGGH